ncbi:MAG: aminoglycoside phosphotransferase family protein [Betaproteobacteria bacterium]|nr:aminoglycoside phosphotransferase family protein [Betaproteobacteria bacterium]
MAGIDDARRTLFLAKADLELPDSVLAALPAASDADLGLSPAVLRAALKAFGLGEDATWHRIASQGTFHRLYDVLSPEGGARLLRVATLRGDEGAQLMELECRLTEALRHAGLPVCHCDWRRVGEGPEARGAHLLERAPGASLSTKDDDEIAMRAALGPVGRFLATLHGISGRGYGPLSHAGLASEPRRLEGLHARWDDYVFLRLEDHLVRCVAAGAMNAGEARDSRAHFDAMREALRAQRPALLHGDPGSHNVIVDAEGIRAVIDWEDALLGDALFDLASLATFHPARRHHALFAGHGIALEADADARRRFWLYFLRIALAKTVHRLRFGTADRPGRPPASGRIQLALGRLAEEA